MKIHVYAICWNEARIAPFFARHYSSFADKIIVYDENSTDGTRDILKKFQKVEIRDWPHKGLDDEKFRTAINTFYKEARGKADWVIWADVDEMIYHPNLRGLLESTTSDAVMTTGYELISKTGYPQDDGRSQIYEIVRTGVRKENYDKVAIFRPGIDIAHAHGRHTYKDWPQFVDRAGRRFQGPQPTLGVKLFHCHSVGGIVDVMQRNQRNYDRSTDKGLAWNMAPEKQFDAEQGGTVAWLEKIIATNALVDVVGETVAKVQFGCGGNRLEGWQNHDVEVNITKPLPYKDNSVSHIFCEHCVEHIQPRDAWNFFEECKRILVHGGVVRIAVPDITKLARDMIPEYCEAVKRGGHGDGSAKSAIRAAICEHGHLAAWNTSLLSSVLSSVGFSVVRECKYHESPDPALRNVEGHWKIVGRAVAECETGIVEAVK